MIHNWPWKETHWPWRKDTLYWIEVFLQRKIEEVLINYEPRINLQNVAVDDDQDNNRLVVDIFFYVVGVPGPQVVQTFLQRVR